MGVNLWMEIIPIMLRSSLLLVVVVWRLETCTVRDVRFELTSLLNRIIHYTHIVGTPSTLLCFVIELIVGFAHMPRFVDLSLL